MNQNQQNQATRNYAEVAAGGSDNPRWEPNKNDTNPNYPKQLEGYFKRTIELPGKNSAFTVAEIQMMNADGTLGQCVDVSGGKVLEDKLREIPLGSWIMIQYLGKVQGKQNTYNDWKTFVDEGAIPLHQIMGVAAPVQHFQQAAPVAQQQAPAFGQPAANPFAQPAFGNAPAPTAQSVFNTPPATNQAPFGQPAPIQNAPFSQPAQCFPTQQAAPAFSQPAFSQAPTQNAAPAFQQQVPAFTQAAPQGFPVQPAVPTQGNGQMPGVPQGTNPFAQKNDDLPFN